jgi:hypothetical protein
MSKTHVMGDDNGEGEVEEFFGQLWWVLSSSTPSPRVQNQPPNLFWIRKDLWETRLFQSKDCFPVQAGDTLKEDPKIGEFAKDFWGKGE